jgi:site-specific DNA-methyltransferase (adenine-specific)
MNTLYLGDCLNVLRDSVADESVDLIYIDPPFNSKRDYNIFFDDKEIQSQRLAFEDTWSLKNVLDSLHELQTMRTENIHLLLAVYQKVAPHAFPYLVMMALRILELHRVLKPTGSFYLHCDPTMSHYLKTVCDIVFGGEKYRNEIIWRRKGGSALKGMKIYSNATDIILFYTKSDRYLFNTVYESYNEEYIRKNFNRIDESGRRFQATVMRSPNPRPNLMYDYKGYKMPPNGWAVSRKKMGEMEKLGLLYFPDDKSKQIYKKIYLDKYPGQPINNLWTDIPTLKGTNSEILGYPTQKPKALLERIIKASSNEGDVVLDGFCGCGTTIDAAEGLHRKWIGIDISPIAISLIKRRLHHSYKKGLSEFEVRGTPTDEQSAQRLWKENAFAFQDWWITEFEAFSATFGTKGADKGVDGIALYAMDNKDTTARVAFQVKGGEKVQSKDIDALLGAIEKHKCDMGIFLTTAEPTKPMLDTVAGAGFVKLPGFEFPKLQILTLKDFFAGKRPKLPSTNITFKAAQHSGKKKENQGALEL